VKAEALAADSEISLVNHVKVVAEAEKEDAGLNHLYKQIIKARIIIRAFIIYGVLLLFNSPYRYHYLLGLHLFQVHQLV
jgi:hypothetical protein